VPPRRMPIPFQLRAFYGRSRVCAACTGSRSMLIWGQVTCCNAVKGKLSDGFRRRADIHETHKSTTNRARLVVEPEWRHHPLDSVDIHLPQAAYLP